MPSFTACKQDLSTKCRHMLSISDGSEFRIPQGPIQLSTLALWRRTSPRIWPCYFCIIPYPWTINDTNQWAMSTSFRKASNLDLRFQVMIELQHPGEVTLICVSISYLNNMSFSFQLGVLRVLSATLHSALTALLFSDLDLIECERKELAFFLGKYCNEV